MQYVNRREFLLTTAAASAITGYSEDVSAEKSQIHSISADSQTIYTGSQTGVVRAVNSQTGEQEWRTDIADHSITSPPTVVGGTVYFGSDNGYAGDSLYALDAATGDVEWVSNIPNGAVQGGPTVINDTVYVGTGGSSAHAIDAYTGEEVWSFTGLTDSTWYAPAVRNESVYIGTHEATTNSFTGGTLHSINADTGEEEWAFSEPAEPTTGAPVVDNGIVYFGSFDGHLYAINAESGEREWRYSPPTGSVYSPPVVTGGAVYIADDRLYSLNPETGALNQQSDRIEAYQLTIVNGTAFVGTNAQNDNDIISIALSDMSVNWGSSVQNGSVSVEQIPTVFDGTVYVQTGSESMLHALDATTGDSLWTFDQPQSDLSASPTAVADPTEGHSVDSRIELGTSGHHHTRAGVEYTPQASFSISILSTNTPIQAGEDLTVEVEVENAGNAQGTKSVALETPSGTQVDSSSITVSPGDTITTTLTWNTESGDATQGDITVTSNNTQVTESVTIEQQETANVTVSLSAPSEVNPETSVDVSATVENTGEVAAEGGATLSVDEETVDSVDAISAGETVTLSASFESGSVGETNTVTIAGPNNASESTTITITEPATAELDMSLDVPNSVEPNTTFDVSGTVENTGEAEASGGATLSVDDETIDSVDVIGASQSVTLRGAIASGEAGSSHTVIIESPDGGSETQTVSVEGSSGGERGDDGSTDGSEQGDGGSTDGSDRSEDSSTSGGEDSSVAVEVPGFGIPSTLTAIGSAGYMIKRRLSEDKEKE